MKRRLDEFEEIRSLQTRLQAARAETVEAGKSAFDAISANQAREQAQRLDTITEAEEVLVQLDELLRSLGLTSERPVFKERLRHPEEGHGNGDEAEAEPFVAISSAGRPRQGGTQRLADGPAHGSSAYYDAILATLSERSGAIALTDLFTELNPRVAVWLNASDLGWIESHKQERWKHRVRWALTQLKKQGKVENPRHGYWKLRRS